MCFFFKKTTLKMTCIQPSLADVNFSANANETGSQPFALHCLRQGFGSHTHRSATFHFHRLRLPLSPALEQLRTSIVHHRVHMQSVSPFS